MPYSYGTNRHYIEKREQPIYVPPKQDDSSLNKRFTEEDDEYIKANYKDKSYRDIAIELNRNELSIKRRVSKLGLRKNNRES